MAYTLLPGHASKVIDAIASGATGTAKSKIFALQTGSYNAIQFQAVGGDLQANLTSSQDGGTTFDVVQAYDFTTQRTQITNLVPGVLYRWDVTANATHPTDLLASQGK